jgi:AsmA protein
VIALGGFKRVGILLAALVAAGIGALVAISLLIPAETVRNAIKAEIRAVTGFKPTIRGEASVSLFPWGTVSFADVTLGAEGAFGRPLAAERITARLRLVPLLFGRIEAADLWLQRPKILIHFPPERASNWAGVAEAMRGAFRPSLGPADSPMSFSEIRIAGGTIEIRDDVRGVLESLTDVEMSLAWPAIAKSFVTTGRFVWREEPIDLSLSLADLSAALEGEHTGLKLRLSGQPFRIGFDGHVSRRPTLKLEGTLAADTPSLRNALSWAGQRPLPGGGFGRFALKAHTTLVAGTVALSGVNIELDGNSADGVLALATDGRPAVQSTLASDELDLRPYISTAHGLRASGREWSRMPIVLDGLADLDVDLRLSAGRIQLGNAKLGRTAIGANLRDGRLTLAIGESQAFGGVLKGSLALARSPVGAEIKSQLQFGNVDLESCLRDLFGIRRLDGKGTLVLAVEATGGSVLALAQTLSGTASLVAENGSLSGVNIEQLLKRLERRPLSGGREFRSGRTPFDRLTVNLTLAAGTASVDDVRLESPAVRLALGGSTSIPARDFDLKGTASLIAADAEAPPEFELPFVIQGPWEDPLLLPDAEILIRRSGAAAPLLDAVRDPKTRDAVRSVIDRLTRPAPKPAAVQPAAAQPVAPQPVVPQPVATPPVVAEPPAAQPAAAQPTAPQSAAAQAADGHSPAAQEAQPAAAPAPEPDAAASQNGKPADDAASH